MKAKLLLLIFIATASLASAQVLVNWNFTSDLTPTIVATTSVASATNATLSLGVSGGRQNNATASNVGPDPGSGGSWSTSNLSAIAPYATGTADAVNGGSGFLNASNFGTSPDSTKYLGFQLTMGSSVDPSVGLLQGISFNLANAGSSGPRGVEVTYRIGTSGGFTSIGGTNVPTNSANQYGLFTFNLASPVALSAGDVIEFRLLGYANATGNSIRLDNVSINAAAIPEPGTYALLMGGLAALFCLRRLNRSRQN